MPEPYLRDDFDPAENASHRDQNQNQISAANQSYQDNTGYYAPGNYYRSDRPSIAPMVVLAVVNMLCCAFGVGFILGLAALVLALIAASEDRVEIAAERLKASKVVNIVGVVLSALQIVLVILALIFFIAVGNTSNYYESGNQYDDFPFEQEYNEYDDFFEDFDIN